VYAENPLTSSAWKDIGFTKLAFEQFWCYFDQCMCGLTSPKTGIPHKKSTCIWTSNIAMHNELNQNRYQCNKQHSHEPLEGAYRGRALTSWAEDYSVALSTVFLRGMIQGEPEPEADPVFAATEQHAVWKCNNAELARQLNILNSPGLYRASMIPLELRELLNKWSGLDATILVCAKNAKCIPALPKDVQASLQTTMIRSDGEWYYNSWTKPIVKRERLGMQGSRIVTVFGDRPAQQTAPELEPQPNRLRRESAEPKPDAVPTNVRITRYLNRLHTSMGHCSNAELVQTMRDAGAANWLIRAAEQFSCSICNAHRPPATRRNVGQMKPRTFNHTVCLDTLDLSLH
jgi:hypothetical protein